MAEVMGGLQVTTMQQKCFRDLLLLFFFQKHTFKVYLSPNHGTIFTWILTLHAYLFQSLTSSTSQIQFRFPSASGANSCAELNLDTWYTKTFSWSHCSPPVSASTASSHDVEISDDIGSSLHFQYTGSLVYLL